MPSHRTRPRSLASRIRRLEREVAALKAAPPVYVPYVAPAYPVIYPMPVPSYPYNPNPFPMTVGEPYVVTVDTNASATCAPSILTAGFTVTATANAYPTIDVSGTTASVNPVITHD